MRSHWAMFDSYWRWKPFALGSVPSSSSHFHTVTVFQFYNCIDVGTKWCTSSSHNIVLDQLARLREALLQWWWAACKVGTSGPNFSHFCILVLFYQDTIFFINLLFREESVGATPILSNCCCLSCKLVLDSIRDVGWCFSETEYPQYPLWIQRLLTYLNLSEPGGRVSSPKKLELVA